MTMNRRYKRASKICEKVLSMVYIELLNEEDWGGWSDKMSSNVGYVSSLMNS